MPPDPPKRTSPLPKILMVSHSRNTYQYMVTGPPRGGGRGQLAPGPQLDGDPLKRLNFTFLAKGRLKTVT